MEGQEIRVMSIAGAAQAVVVGGSDRGDDVVALEQSIGILKPMAPNVGVMNQDTANLPIP